MKRKLLLLLLSIFTLSIILVACGDDDSSADTDTDTDTEDVVDETDDTDDADDADDDEPVVIRFHTHGNEANYNWSTTIAEFEDAHPGIEVDLIILSESGDTQEANQALDLASSGGEPMDVLMFSNPADYAQRVALDMTQPLDDFIAEEGFQVDEEYRVDTFVDGNYHALPGKFNPWYVLLNKDHLDEAGLDVPLDWTWDDFRDYAAELTTDDRYGAYFHGPQEGGWMEYLKLHLASKPEETDLLKDDGTSNVTDPYFRETLELRYAMEKEDQSVMPYTEIMSQQTDYRAQFFQQNNSMLLIGSWMNTELGGTDQFPLDFNVAVAPYPKNNADDEGGYTPVTTDFVSLASRSENPEEAYKFIRWFTTEGQLSQGKNIPSWNGVDDGELAGIIEEILEDQQNPENVDIDSLVDTILNSRASRITEPVGYQAEVYNVVSDEYEKLIYDVQDIDETIENADEQIAEIVERNQ